MNRSPEDEIKKFCIECGVDTVGIASVEDINQYAPLGHRPNDFLVGANSVIVLAGHWTTRGAWQSPKYLMHTSNRVFDVPRRKAVSLSVAELVEEKYGHYCITFEGPGLSLKLCAELAGLGTRSMAAGIILNRDIGPLHITIVITTMPLHADGPLNEPVCPDLSCVKRWEHGKKTPCLEACPECLTGEIEDGRIKRMQYNRHLCATRAQTTSIGGFQRALLEAINEPDPEKRKTMIMGSYFGRALHSIASGIYVGQCGECLRGCPISVRARTLRPKI